MKGWLREAAGRGLLRDLDLHFARLMGRLAGDESDHLLVAAALASFHAGEGHVCLALRPLAGVPLFDGLVETPPWPEWRKLLLTSPVVGGPEDDTPLTLDLDDRLYLGRYRRYEANLAEALAARAQWAEGVDETLLAEGLERLFPLAGGGPDWQRLAAALAVLRRLAVISGGPGTGKTRTVTSILALLAEQRPGMRMALAAPTGKAAARLSESIKQAKGELPLTDGVREAIPDEAATLHRLLGLSPGRVRPRHHAGNPLHLDLLVVDEASMVDLPLMARLLDALPERARLILLGDRDQLASVEAGAVLGDICGRAAGWSVEMCAQLASLGGEGIAPVAGAPAVADSIATLRRSYRFHEASGIGALARAVNGGEGEAALGLLRSGEFADLDYAGGGEPEGRIADEALKHYRPYLEVMGAAGSPEAALAAFGRFRILCALREGPFGVRRANEAVERAVRRAGLIAGDGPWYAGRPVMVTRNDYALGLFNGDVGLILPNEEGALRAFFPRPDGTLRSLHPNRLPEHETVYAMTVHKSQGSEFDRVLLMLPDDPAPVVSRELLYTAITRARREVAIHAAPRAVVAASARRLQRFSGLEDRLWGERAEEAPGRSAPAGYMGDLFE